MNKALNVLKYLGILGLSFIASIFIFMQALDDIVINVSSSPIVFIAGRIVGAILIYIIIISLINKTIKDLQLDILGIVYILFVLCITFFKGSNNAVCAINLNPMQIIHDFKMADNTGLLLLGNFICYIPVSIYLRYKLNKHSNLSLVLGFIVFDIILELIQYMLQYGNFDINDVIINIAGFFTGIIVYKFISNQKRNSYFIRRL